MQTSRSARAPRPDRRRRRPRPEVVAVLRSAGCVFAEDEAAVLVEVAAGPVELAGMLERRVAGVPLEHVVGWVEFAGRRFAVDDGVFVPRRRSELLVREALTHLARSARRPAVVADLCCGCGAIGAAIAAAGPGIELVATDLDPAAIRCAARNVAAVGGTVARGDLFTALPDRLRGRVDVLVANAPYVPTDAIALMPPEARDHEPAVALDGGPDGTAVLRRLISGAPPWLAPGGLVLVEVGEPQVPTVLGALEAAGLAARIVADEDLGGTVALGRRTDAAPGG